MPSPARTTRLLPALSLALACESEPTRPDAYSAFDGDAPALVNDVVSKVAVTPDSQLVFAGDQLRVTATATNSADEALVRTFAWKSSNPSVVTAVGPSLSTMTFRAITIG